MSIVSYLRRGKKYFFNFVLTKTIDSEKPLRENALYFFWDLERYGPNYDIVRSLAMAEILKNELNKKYICIIIVPPIDGKFPKYIYENLSSSGSELEKKDVEAHFHLKLKNIFIPCCFLFKSCQSVYICSSRTEAEFINKKIARQKFPYGYNIYKPHLPMATDEKNIMEKLNCGFEMPSINAESCYCNFVDEWIDNFAGGRKVITITLRESYRYPDRNSNIKEWSQFIESLDKSIYFPVIIRDTEKSLTILPNELHNFSIFNEASWNVGLRMALYEKSYLNLGVNNGPLILCLFNSKCRCIIYKFLTSSCPYASMEYHKSLGLIPGGRYLMCNEFQKLVWEDDTYDIIAAEFKNMCEDIEKNKFGTHTYEK